MLPEANKSRGGKCEAVPTREVICAPLVEDVVTRWMLVNDGVEVVNGIRSEEG